MKKFYLILVLMFFLTPCLILAEELLSLKSIISTDINRNNIQLVDKRLYISQNHTKGLQVYDLNNINEPKEVGSIGNDFGFRNFLVIENYLYALITNDLYIFDISSLDNVKQISELSLNGMEPLKIVKFENTLYILDRKALFSAGYHEEITFGISQVDIMDVSNPV